MKKIFQYYEVRPTLTTNIEDVGPATESFLSMEELEKALSYARNDVRMITPPTMAFTLYGRSWDKETQLWLPTTIQDFDTVEEAFEMFTAITGLISPEQNFEPLHGYTGTLTVSRFAKLLAASHRKPESSMVEGLPVAWALEFMITFPVWLESPEAWENAWDDRTRTFFNKVWPEFRVGDLVVYEQGSGHAFRSGGFMYPGAVVIQVEPLVCASTGGDMRWESTLEPKYLKFHDIARIEGLAAAMTRLDK